METNVKTQDTRQLESKGFHRSLDLRTLISAGLLVVLGIVLKFSLPDFYSPINLGQLSDQVVINGLLAIGMTFAILIGGIDLSVGAVLFLVNCLSVGLLVNNNLSTPVMVLVCLGVGTVFGCVNGILISYGRLQAFAVTLATMTIGFGLAFLYTQGRPINGDNEFLMWLGTAAEHKIPLIFTSLTLRLPPYAFLLAFCMLAGWLVLAKTTLGRRLYAVGSNEQAARLSGIPVQRVKTAAYAICGFMAALAGLAYTGRVGVVGQVTEGANYELDAIAAVVVGGTSLVGGYGGMVGTLIGVLLLGVLNNVMGLFNVDPYLARIIKGVVILLAVLFQKRRN